MLSEDEITEIAQEVRDSIERMSEEEQAKLQQHLRGSIDRMFDAAFEEIVLEGRPRK
jgi:vacuolar-type H+-ATPase subunit E/Vma4